MKLCPAAHLSATEIFFYPDLVDYLTFGSVNEHIQVAIGRKFHKLDASFRHIRQVLVHHIFWVSEIANH